MFAERRAGRFVGQAAVGGLPRNFFCYPANMNRFHDATYKHPTH